MFVLAASNLPWDLDAAILRRLEKRVMVPLPTKKARKLMIKNHLSNFSLENGGLDTNTGFDYLDYCSEKTENYSGSDVKLLCKEIAMRPVRRILKQLNELEMQQKHSQHRSRSIHKLLHQTYDSRVVSSIAPASLNRIMKENVILLNDIKDGVNSSVYSTNRTLCLKYQTWEKEFGSLHSI